MIIICTNIFVHCIVLDIPNLCLGKGVGYKWFWLRRRLLITQSSLRSETLFCLKSRLNSVPAHFVHNKYEFSSVVLLKEKQIFSVRKYRWCRLLYCNSKIPLALCFTITVTDGATTHCRENLHFESMSVQTYNSDFFRTIEPLLLNGVKKIHCKMLPLIQIRACTSSWFSQKCLYPFINATFGRRCSSRNDAHRSQEVCTWLCSRSISAKKYGKLQLF